MPTENRRRSDLLGAPRRFIDSVFVDPGFSYYAAGVYLILGTAFFIDQTVSMRTSVGQALHPYDIVWNALEIAGAVLVIASAINRRWRHAYEAAGLILMVFAWSMQLTSSLAVQGLDDLRSWVFVPIITSGALRYRRLLRQG